MRTVPNAVEGVRTPPSCESGGREVPFGGGSTRDRALSAIKSERQLASHEHTGKRTVRDDVSGIALRLARRDDLDVLLGRLRDVGDVHETLHELLVRNARARLGQDEVEQPPSLA